MVMSAYKAYLDYLSINKTIEYKDNYKHVYCTNDCDLFNYGDIYICKANGNVHTCTSEDCNLTVSDREHRVCKLTSIVYSLDFDDRQFDTSYNPEENDEIAEIHTEDQEYESADCSSMAVDDNTTTMNAIIDHTHKKKKNRKPCVPVASQLHIYDKGNRILNEYVQIFESLLAVEKTKADDVLKRQVGLTCRLLWQTICTSQFWKECTNKRVFRSDYHAIVVIYAMIDGLQTVIDSTEKWIIPKVNKLAELLPLSSNIRLMQTNQSKPTKIRWFTTYGKRFRTALKNISDEEWRRYFIQANKIGLFL